MNSEPIPVRAPQDAVAWSPDGGFVYHVADLPTEVGPGHYVLHVNADGVINVPVTQPAPLSALLRVDADVSELVARVSEVDTLRVKMLAAAERLTETLSEPAETEEP